VASFGSSVPLGSQIEILIYNVVPNQSAPSLFIALDTDYDSLAYAEYKVLTLTGFQLTDFQPSNGLQVMAYTKSGDVVHTFPVSYQIDFMYSGAIQAGSLLLVHVPSMFE
jgi:hypothetical protein